MTIKYTAKLWLSPDKVGTVDLSDKGNPQRVFDQVHVINPTLKMETQGWVYIGIVDMVFHISRTEQELRIEAADRLREELKKADADHEHKRTQVIARINSLLALEAPVRATVPASIDDDIPF